MVSKVGGTCYLLEPFFVRHLGESISDDTCALVFPQRHERSRLTDDFGDGPQHTLPNAAQITQVEDVMEFGRGRQHLDLGALPQTSCGRNEFHHEVGDVAAESALRAVVAFADSEENFVDGRVRWQRAVEDSELALESLRNVVPSAARMDHGTNHLQETGISHKHA